MRECACVGKRENVCDIGDVSLEVHGAERVCGSEREGENEYV